MRIESVGTVPINNDSAASKQNGMSFETVLSATIVQDSNSESDDNYTGPSNSSDSRSISLDEMIELEAKAAAAFNQGDLINYQQSTKTLSEYKQTIDEGVQQMVAVEEAQNNIEQGPTRRGLFPKDAPQSLKDFESSLSLGEKMSFMMAVSVQKLIANAYQDTNGRWNIRRQGEAGYVDIFQRPDFSYTKLAEDMLVYLQFERTYLRPDEFKAKEDVLNGFKTAVEGY